jgi:hypothetical protein
VAHYNSISTSMERFGGHGTGDPADPPRGLTGGYSNRSSPVVGTTDGTSDPEYPMRADRQVF